MRFQVLWVPAKEFVNCLPLEVLMAGINFRDASPGQAPGILEGWRSLLPWPMTGGAVIRQLQPVRAAQRNRLWVIAKSRAMLMTLATPRTVKRCTPYFTRV